MTDQYDIINHDSNGRGSTKAIECVAQQAEIAFKDHYNLTNDLMKEIASIANLKCAFKSVKRNKGAPGIDKTSIEEIDAKLDFILEDMCARHVIEFGGESPL